VRGKRNVARGGGKRGENLNQRERMDRRERERFLKVLNSWSERREDVLLLGEKDLRIQGGGNSI